MREQGLCVNTRAKVHALLGQVFQYGVQIGWIKADPNGNYVTAVQATKKPKGKLMRRMDLDADQARMLLDMAQASGNRWAEAVEILVRTGLRRVELLGLQWSKVTLDTDGGDGGWLMVSASLHRQAHTLGGQSRLELATTKTKSSNRPIRLTVEGVAALQRQYERQAAEQQAAGSRWIGGDAGSDDMPIFANVFGGWSETTGFNKGFRAIADAAGFKDMTAHGCRHTFVSLLANQMLRETGRIDWQAIADMGGWADIATVQRVYAHLRQSELDQARRQSWTQAGAVQI
jgi:integrase